MGKQGLVVKIDSDGDVHVNFPELSRTLCVAPHILSTSLGSILTNLKTGSESVGESLRKVSKKEEKKKATLGSSKQSYPEYGKLPDEDDRRNYLVPVLSRKIIVDMPQVFSMSLPAAIVAGPNHQHRSWKVSMDLVGQMQDAGWYVYNIYMKEYMCS